MKRLISLGIITFFVILNPLQAFETCSRTAIINHQEVLVDTNSNQKGEGLRFYLEKDPKAEEYLNKYQNKNKIRWQNAVMGTAGTGMLLSGLLINSNSNTKQTLYVSGASLILVNFLVARTLEMANEQNLLKAIEEYNKRNLPRIYFNPGDGEVRDPSSQSPSFSIGKTWSF